MPKIEYKKIELTYNNGSLYYDLNITNPVANKDLDTNIKILNATVELTNAGNSLLGIKVVNARDGSLVDYLQNAGSNSKVCINITDEMNDLVKRADIGLNFLLDHKGSLYLSNSSPLDFCPKLYIEYESSRLIKTDNAYHKFSALRAGFGKINLASGELNFTHNDVKSDGYIFPININHSYNTHMADKSNGYFNYNGVIKTLPNYSCGNGWKLNLQQYLVKQQSNSSITTKTTDSYTYIDAEGNYHSFEEQYYYETIIGTVKKKHYLPKESIFVDIDDNLWFIAPDMVKYEVKLDLKTTSGLKLISKLEGFTGIKYLGQRGDEMLQLEETVSQLNDAIINVNQAIRDNEASAVLFAKLKAIRVKQQEIEDESVKLNTLNLDYTASLQDDKKAELDKLNKDYADTEEALQATKLTNELTNLNSQKEKYEKQLVESKKALSDLIIQTPQFYLVDDNSNTLGFCATSDEDVFRLIVVADIYNNQLYINYENNQDKPNYDRIVSVVDSENNVLRLDYDFAKLSRITDSRGRRTCFEYGDESNSECVSKIVYPDGKETKYYYDLSFRLTQIIDQSGYGVKLEYAFNQVVGVIELTTVNQISYQQGVSYVDGGSLNNNEVPNILGDSIIIDYYDYKSTTITDCKGQKTTYVFDIDGRPVTIYENNFENFINNTLLVGTVKTISHDYINDRRAFSISTLPNATELISNSAFSSATITASCAENYVGDAICDSGEYLVTYPIASNIGRLAAKNADSNFISATVNITPSSSSKDYIFSGWARADSAFINRDRKTEFSYNEIDNTHFDSFDQVKRNRRFELRAVVSYRNAANTEKRLEEFYNSFDWMNTDWQYCAVPIPIKLKDDEVKVTITLQLDYSYNTNSAEFAKISLKDGQWEYSEFNEHGNVIKSENSMTDIITTNSYNEDEKLVKSIMTDKDGNEFTSTCDYNQSGMPLRTVDYKGIITENVYDENGTKIKTITYHKDEPSQKFYSESLIDQKGKATGEINILGDKIIDYEFVDGTDIVSAIKQTNGQKISYGYDYTDDTLLEISSNVDEHNNTNTYGYTLGNLTRVTHNNFNYDYTYDGFGKMTKIIIADKEYATIVYDKAKNAITTTLKVSNAINEKFETITDNKGNITKISYTPVEQDKVPILENTYDSCNRLVSTLDKSDVKVIAHTFTYDKFGRAIKDTATNTIATSEFDVNGNLIASTFKINADTAKSYAYNYDARPKSKLKSIILPNNSIQNLFYDGLDRIKNISIDEKFTKDFYYLSNGDHTTNMVSSIWYGINGLRKENLKYTYDTFGNMLSVKENGKLVAKYSYDGIDRLVREDNKLLGTSYTYTYDAGGNIVSHTEYDYTTAESLLEKDGKTFDYAYKSAGWKDQLMSYSYYDTSNVLKTETFEYDNLGNPTIFKGKICKWSHGRQLDAYDNSSVTFKYNANGLRQSKTNSGLTTNYYYNGDKLMCSDDGANKLYFNYGAEGIVGFNLNGAEYMYQKNVQGDIIAIYDINGTLKGKYIYDAWGKHKILNANNIDITSIIEYNVCRINPIRYRGYYYDAETQLYYLQSRYYDAHIGRFINADDVSYIDKDMINGLNLYSYCMNNPVMRVDSKGNAWWDVFKWIAVGALAIAAVAAIVVGTVVTGGALGAVLIGAGIGIIAGGAVGGGIAAANGYDIAGGILLGGAIGGITGALIAYAAPIVGTFLSSTFSVALPSVAIGGGSLIATTISITGAQIASGLVGLGILFARTGRSGGFWGEKWPGDHSPDHAHLKGEDGTNIRIDHDGNPLPKEGTLKPPQRRAIKRLLDQIRKLFGG